MDILNFITQKYEPDIEPRIGMLAIAERDVNVTICEVQPDCVQILVQE